MANGSIDYDYDEVIDYISTTPCTAVNDLATNLNTLGNNLTDMQEQFHSTNMKQVVGKIYTGFSNIIGDDNNGLSRLDREAANVLNICYNEAKSDKSICETGEMDNSTTDVSATSDKVSEGTSNMQMGTETSTNTDVYNNNEANGFVVSGGHTTGYQLTDDEYNTLAAIISAECDGTNDDALAVASVIFNRTDDPKWVASHGTSPYSQATAANQFVVYQNGTYSSYMPQNGGPSEAAKNALDSVLNGTRNCDYLSFRSNGSSSYSSNMITPSGNRYK